MKKYILLACVLFCNLVSPYSFSASDENDIYSLRSALTIGGLEEENQTEIASAGVHLKLNSTQALVSGAEVTLTLPSGKLVTGVVKRTIAERKNVNPDAKAPQQSQAYAYLRQDEPAADSITVISFKAGAGALRITERDHQIVAMHLHDVSKGEIYQAEIDANGRGEFVRQDIGQYLCAEYPEPSSYGLEEIEARLPEHIPSLVDLRELQSKPGSARTLYLNNWGGILRDTAWNDSYNEGQPIHFTPYSKDEDTANFSDIEKKLMWLAWREVSEDFAMFNINVTTSQAVFDATPVHKRSQIIATTTRDFYPRRSGGVAYLGSINDRDSYYKTGFNWVTSIDAGMAYSHESGHQMGLSHDGTSSKEYYSGHGEWGPIMGAPYGKKYVQWSHGDYADANQHQDDIGLLILKLRDLADDAGESIVAATPLPFPSREHVGQITPAGSGYNDDIDVYEFTISSNKQVNISVDSALLAESEFQGSNLALDVKLADDAGVIISHAASSDLVPLSTKTNRFQFIGPLEAGNYYLIIDGVSPDTDPTTGFDEYGNGGQYVMTVEALNALSDVDGDGIADNLDNCPMVANPNQINSDAQLDGGDACDLDDDNDGYSDGDENGGRSNRLDPASTPPDLDKDFIADWLDRDMDGDGVNNFYDDFPRDASETTDTDNDGMGDNTDPDIDNDGVPNDEDAFPLDATESIDTDKDGIGDNTDPDIDNDGVDNDDDAFPLDKWEQHDSDKDGIGDKADPDDDNDGYTDEDEWITRSDPYDPLSTPPDLDNDFVPDWRDKDIDNDGVPNNEDAFPRDASESIDTDGDLIGNNADLDDDNDGYSDEDEIGAGSLSLDASSTPPDLDNDLVPDWRDADIDNDGVPNDEDDFPRDASETTDTDNDGIGDNTDPDIDNDSVNNDKDAFPRDASESMDSDGDRIGNNADLDDDNDGYSDVIELAEGTNPLDSSSTPADLDNDLVPDSIDPDIDNDSVPNDEDAFPRDASESMDTDGDLIGNNADLDDDNDGYSDVIELEEGTNPLDSSSTPDDLDKDFVPDSIDPDIDNDGFNNEDDAFPRDASESIDTDGDRIGNNADLDDDNDGYSDVIELEEGTNPLDSDDKPDDLDKDLVPDSIDPDIDGDGVNNDDDAFPRDANETTDTDKDGIGNNADLDDDNDGYSDVIELEEGTNPLDSDDKPDDLDKDLVPDSIDPDIDNDGVPNDEDAFPRDASESIDTDLDGIGNNADPDDDNDGIIDAQDTAPLDPSVGDALPPVFGDIKELTIEATGSKTPLVLVEPEVTDNNLYPFTLTSDYTEPLGLGSHNILWTAVDYANNRAVKTQVVHIVDTRAPVIDDTAEESIDASGITTDISSQISSYAFDIVDGEVPLTIANPRLKSGQHRVAVSATDGSGNVAEGYLNIKLNPQVSLLSEEVLASGGHYPLKLTLSGEAAVYPVVVGYQISGAIEGAATGEVSFDRGIEQFIDINISNEARDGDEVTIRLTRAENAVIGNDQQVLTVSKQNFAPQVDLVMQQAGHNTQVIDPSLGTVTVFAQVVDKNSEDTHQFSWESNDGSIQDLNLDGVDTSFEFDPANLPQQVFSLQVTVDDNNIWGPLTAKAQQDLVIHRQTGSLSADTDSDNDGVSDKEEGYVDSDLDGIPDYLDVEMDRSRLPIADNTAPLQTLPNLRLALGSVVLSSCGFDCSYSALTDANIAEYGSEGTAKENGLDSHFTAASHIINYRISNLGQDAPAAVVIPLEESQSIPEQASYRILSPSGSWQEFSLDANNSIASATADSDGNCPVALSERYGAGLNNGDNCIQLTMEDGGMNDLDHSLNGVITAVGKMAVEVVNQLPVISLESRYEVPEGGELILDASGTQDAEGDSLSYHWQQLSGVEVNLSDVQDARLIVSAPLVSSNETVRVRLTVNDGFDTVEAIIDISIVDVKPALSLSLESDKRRYSGGGSILVSANAQGFDDDNLSYLWSQSSGERLNITDPSAKSLTLTAPMVSSDTTFMLQLTVSDGANTLTESIELVVNKTVASTSNETSEGDSGGSLSWWLALASLLVVRRRLG